MNPVINAGGLNARSTNLTDAYGNYVNDPLYPTGTTYGGGLRQFAPTETQVAQNKLNSADDERFQKRLDQDLFFDGTGRRKARDEGRPYNPQGGNSGQAGGGGGNTLENLFKLLGLGNEGVGGSSQTTVGDVSQSTGDTLSPLLAALTSIFGTQSGQDVAFGSQAIQKLLGQEQNANNRFQTQTQQQIADNANTEAARFQTAQYGEAERRAQSNLDRFNQLIPGRPGNPLLQAPRRSVTEPTSSEDMANLAMSRGSVPRMRIG